MCTYYIETICFGTIEFYTSCVCDVRTLEMHLAPKSIYRLEKKTNAWSELLVLEGIDERVSGNTVNQVNNVHSCALP